jgi:hypothetical protein
VTESELAQELRKCICPTHASGPEYSLTYIAKCPVHGRYAHPHATPDDCTAWLDKVYPQTEPGRSRACSCGKFYQFVYDAGEPISWWSEVQP